MYVWALRQRRRQSRDSSAVDSTWRFSVSSRTPNGPQFNAISEAALSFLGFGLPISVPSWGGMLSREGREFMDVAPRLALWPGLCLTVVVYCLNMFGDAVRDLLDPRLRGGGGRLGADRGASL